MFRFIACVWDPNREDHERESSRTRIALQQQLPAYRVLIDKQDLWCACADATHDYNLTELPGHAGIIAGSAYETATDSLGEERCARLRATRLPLPQILASGGGALVELAWGDYVALLRDQHKTVFVTAATGNLPCLIDVIDDFIYAYSNVVDARKLGLRRHGRTHAYTHARVWGDLIADVDPLDGQMRLLRGEALTIHARSYQRFERKAAWYPTRIAERLGRIEDPTDAAKAVRASILCASRTLTAAHPSVLLRLSGGLDSSIVAGSLRQCASHTHAHTYVAKGTSADARVWAARVAKFCDFPWVETQVDPGTLDLSVLTRLLLSPDVAPTLEYLFRKDLERSLCRRSQSTAVLTGDGGDSGFCSDSIALALLEFLRLHGPTPQALRLASQIARALHLSTATLLRRALTRWRRGQRMEDQIAANNEARRLVNVDVPRRTHEKLPHPWFSDDEEVRWDIWYRLGALVMPTSYYDLSVAPDVFAPLILEPLHAQPVVETLLRIPIYRHFENGRDRGLARRAFIGDAPRENLERLWKDRAPGFLEDLLVHHRRWLREIFLDGILVRDRLLDRARVERALSSTALNNEVLATEIFRHLDTELWARRCDDA